MERVGKRVRRGRKEIRRGRKEVNSEESNNLVGRIPGVKVQVNSENLQANLVQA